MEGMIMTAQLLLSLSILIVVHEGGHFVAARTFNIKVEKFYLFFDFLFPMANVLNFSLLKFKKGDTEYGIGWFPLGGYVKIAGMVDESMDKEQLKKAPEPWEFRAKPAWQRLIVMLGGVIVNVVVGILIFIGLTYFLGDTYIPKNFVNTHGGIQALALGEQMGFKTGDQIIKINGKDFEDFQDVAKPDLLLTQGSFYTVLRKGEEVTLPIPGDFIENFNKKESHSNYVQPRFPATVGRVLETVPVKTDSTHTIEGESIAHKVGLKVGDKVVEVNGQPVAYWDELTRIVKNDKGDSIRFTINREGQTMSYKASFKGQEMIGFGVKNFNKSDIASIQYGLGTSIGIGTVRAFNVIFIQLKAFKKIFTGELSFRKSLSGPIVMAQAYGGEWDWQRFWSMTGLLSMVLAFMNLLPIPALDGGYVMFLLYEMVSGREPSEKFFESALKVGMAILLVLMVFVFYNDIIKVFT
jgi:regulator of sigma E protease